MFQRKASTVLLSLAGLGAAQVSAQAQEETFRLNALADIRFVENADMRPSSAEGIDQWEWRGGLSARGQLSNDWARWVTDYELQDRRYSEQEGFDDQVLLGRSTLQLGQETQRLYGVLSHSTRELLLDPAEGEARRNIDQRTITDAAVYGSLEPGAGNRVSAWLSASDIRYGDTDVNDAQRYGGGVSYTRLLSPLSNISGSISGYNLDYQALDTEMIYTRAALSWQTQLRYLSYELEGGYNQARSEGRTFSSPFVNITLDYERASQGWRFSARQWVSDTSQGRGEFDIETVAPDRQAGRLGVIDQLLRQELMLAWRHDNPCIGCRLIWSVGVESEEFREFDQFDNREWFSRIDFTYIANRHVTLGSGGRFRYYDLTDRFTEGDYVDYRLELRAIFTSLMTHGQLEWYAGSIWREYEARDGYTSAYTGVTLRYQLYSR